MSKDRKTALKNIKNTHFIISIKHNSPVLSYFASCGIPIPSIDCIIPWLLNINSIIDRYMVRIYNSNIS